MANLKITKRGILAALLLFSISISAADNTPSEFSQGMEKFVDEMVQKHGFERSAIRALMQKARYRQTIIDAITRPYEAKPWYQYRALFVTPERTQAGVAFWQENQALLDKAAAEYGVPPEIIVAIIGVETRYGNFMGNYPVLDALSTLAFAYPPRADFFRRQLEEFLLLRQEERIDASQVSGSYAGAIGMPQFIPSSYRNYAVDFDGDGQRDLVNSRADAIGSVANYFREHGWSPGEMVAVPAKVEGSDYNHFANFDLKPNASVEQLANVGVTSGQPLPQDMQTTLLQLETENGEEHWLGFQNFYVITRYNHSALYAMAVYQLSQEILALRNSQPHAKADAPR